MHPFVSSLRPALFAVLLGAPASSPAPWHGTALDRVVPNDNRRPAGTLRNGVLTLALEARVATWHPDGDAAPGVGMPAFAEAGKAPSIPGPLIRVPAGTVVELDLRNALTDTLNVRGLFDRTSQGTARPAHVVAPGERQHVRFRLDIPGTYLYWGATTRRTLDFRTLEDAQLSGAIVVDSGPRPPRDRIFVIGMWTDTVARSRVPRRRVLAVLNGRSWPSTERLEYATGDSVRWRLINASADAHPMHLHGFHFRVDARGDGAIDSTFTGDARTLSVTETMASGGTLALTWVPERPGNWLFHCHIPEHFGPRAPLGEHFPDGAGHDHSTGGMSGLVLGVRVRAGRNFSPVPTRLAERPMRLLIRPARAATAGMPLFSYTLHEGGAESPASEGYAMAPTLDLVRGQPVRIQVVNRLHEPTAVHWHGIELESFFDGVPGFSGAPRRITPLIAPGDSFEVRFTPPRAGTFIYHTHADEARQQAAGLAGPIIVRHETAPRDSAIDIPLLITEDPDPATWNRRALVNGSPTPPPIMMKLGTTYRLRMIQMAVTWAIVRPELWRDSALQSWRIVAKDGADRPASLRAVRPAWLRVGIGEAYDIEITPTEEGTMHLNFRQGLVWPRPAPLLTVVPIHVTS